MPGGWWGIVVVLGPILLIVALIWAFRSNRKADDRTIRKAERGARELREDLEDEQVP